MSDDDPIPLDLAARVARQAMPDAAREVDALRAEVERLREVLRDIESGDYDDPRCWRIRQRAREALEGAP